MQPAKRHCTSQEALTDGEMTLEDLEQAVLGGVATEPETEDGTKTETEIAAKTEDDTKPKTEIAPKTEDGTEPVDKSVIEIIPTPKGVRLAFRPPETSAEAGTDNGTSIQSSTEAQNDNGNSTEAQNGNSTEAQKDNGKSSRKGSGKRGQDGQAAGEGPSPGKKPTTLVDKFWSAKEKRDKNKARLSDLEEAIQNNEKLLELRNSSHTLPPAKKSLEMVEGVVNSNFRRMIMALAKKTELANMMKK